MFFQYTAGAIIYHLALAIKTTGSSADTRRSEVDSCTRHVFCAIARAIMMRKKRRKKKKKIKKRRRSKRRTRENRSDGGRWLG